MINTVYFQKKSSYQKDTCIRCPNKSNIEVNAGDSVLIRCCEEKQCKLFAVELALYAANAIEKRLEREVK